MSALSIDCIHKYWDRVENLATGTKIIPFGKSSLIVIDMIIPFPKHVHPESTVYSACERGYNVILPVGVVASDDKGRNIIYLHNFPFFSGTLCPPRIC